MNAVSGFILLSLIANCQFRPVTEFDVDFQVIEQIQESYRVSRTFATYIYIYEYNEKLYYFKKLNILCTCP